MTVIKVKWGKFDHYFNFGCEKFVESFLKFLNLYGWHNYTVYENSAAIETIDASAESIKTEMIGEFWNWLHAQTNGAA